MSHQAHKRFIFGAGFLIIIALVVAVLAQAAVIDGDLLFDNSNCQGSLVSAARLSACAEDSRSPEPVTVLIFGIGLAGIGFAIRRQFSGAR